MTSRRAFLASLGAAFLASLGAAFALDPERALWVPGARTISIPAPQAFVTPSWPVATRAWVDGRWTWYFDRIVVIGGPPVTNR